MLRPSRCQGGRGKQCRLSLSLFYDLLAARLPALLFAPTTSFLFPENSVVNLRCDRLHMPSHPHNAYTCAQTNIYVAP